MATVKYHNGTAWEVLQADSPNYIVPTSVVSQLINITTAGVAKRIPLQINTTVTGGNITIRRNGGTTKNLLNPDGTNVTELNQETKYFEIIEETTSYILKSSGSGDGIVQQETEPAGTKVGRLWLDLSSNTYQGTVFEELETGKLNKNGDTLESYSEKLLTNGAATGTINLDLSVQDNFNLTTSGAITLNPINVPTTGKAVSFTVAINQGGTAYAITHPTNTQFSNGNIPDTSAINKTHILSYISYNGGTRWYGNANLSFTT